MNNHLTAFSTVTKTIEGYRQCVRETLTTYSHEYHRNENLYTQSALDAQRESAKKKAAEQLAMHRAHFKQSMNAAADALSGALGESLTQKPPTSFLDTLRVYVDFNLTPSRIEVEELLKSGCGYSLSVRALNSVLERTGANLRVSAPTSTEIISAVELAHRLATENTWFPSDADAFHDFLVITGSTQKSLILTWCNEFDSRANELEKLSKQLGGSFVPTIEVVGNDIPEEQAELVQTALENSEIHSEGEDIAFAKTMAKAETEQHEMQKRTMAHYTGKREV